MHTANPKRPETIKRWAAVREIRTLGLSCKVYEGEFRIDYKRKDSRFRPDTWDEVGNEIGGTSVYETDPESALATAKAMAAWQPT